jgi:choline dehydrogenase
MLYVRCHKWDYDHWAKLGNEGWSYHDVLPYFKKSEHNENIKDKYHGTNGPLNVCNPTDESQLNECDKDMFLKGEARKHSVTP